MKDLTTNIGTLALANPLLTASGTFAFGREMADYYDLAQLGGVVTKAVSLEARAGNPAHRIAECSGGLLNSVGLQNPGLDAFLRTELPWLLSQNTPVIVNAAGDTVEDYVRLCRRLEDTAVAAIELNLSCPNVTRGMAFGASSTGVFEVTKACREVTAKPLWVKLTPNVTDIAETAKAAEAAGADAVSAINTLLGLRIDLASRRPVLKRNRGGYSGPAIKPIALSMVFAISQQIKIPVVGIGGIMTAADVVEFLLAGAAAVQVGTANLLDPLALPKILKELPAALDLAGAQSVRELVGGVRVWA